MPDAGLLPMIHSLKSLKKMTKINNCAVVIFGASGDLAKRKLVPALEVLYKQKRLCENSIFIGSGRSAFTDDEFRARFDVDPEFAKHIFYHQYTSGLKSFIASKGAFDRVVFFFSLPPVAYGPTARELVADGFGGESSIIIEKPFGYNYESAKKLDNELAACLKESQIYRIDHYLAKEAVQNIKVFRFANTLFNPVWNNSCIESIQISALEKEGIVERGTYFDNAGIIRDMIQNHLLQLLCILTMEPPVSLKADDIKAQKVSVLRTFRIEECYRYQYDGYLQEKDIRTDSKTETFAEMRLSINNFRWTGVPVYIRTGKALHRRGTEIGIRFKKIPNILFNENGNLAANQIIFKIQPAEGIIMDIHSKIPGTDDQITQTNMNFCYRDSFGNNIPEAYQRLLFDVLRGDHTLFVSSAETEAAWRLVDGILDKGDLTRYAPGRIPESKLGIRWIDFEKYVSLCS
jgi:glucose-6-phosphate 1-dehydrogenase